MAPALSGFSKVPLLLLAGVALFASVASADQERGIKVLPATSNLAIYLQAGHHQKTSQFAYTPDGRVFVSLSPSDSLKFWDGGNGRLLRSVDADKDDKLAMSPDGQLVATAHSQGVVRIWEVSTGRLLRTLPHQEGVRAIGFLPEGSRIASTTSEGTLLVSDIRSGERLSAISVATKTGANDVDLSHLAFTRDSKQVVVAVNRTVQNSLAVVDIASGQITRKIKLGFDKVNSLAISSDGRRAATASGGKGAQLWDLETGGKLSAVGREVAPSSIVFSADGGSLVLVGSGGTRKSFFDNSLFGLVEIWSGDGSTLTRSFRLPGDGGSSAVLAKDDRSIAFNDGGRIRFLDLQTSTLSTLATGELSSTLKLAFSPDGSKLAMGSFGRLQLLDFEHPARSQDRKVASEWVTAIAFRPDGSGLAVAAGNETATWPLPAGQPVQSLSHAAFAQTRTSLILSNSPKVISVAYDGSATLMAVTADAPTLQLWDLPAGKQRLVIPAPDSGHWISQAALSGDGRVVAAEVASSFLAQGRSLLLWDTKDGHLLATIAKTACSALALNHDGTLAACAGENIRIIDTFKGKVLNTLQGKWPVSFGADDATLFCGVATKAGEPGTEGVRQWDTRSGLLLRSLDLPAGIEVRDFAISPNGKTIAVAGSDKLVRLFGDDQGRELMTVALVGAGWIVMSPEGYFDASSPKEENALLVRFGEGLFDVLPVASFRERFYRPDIIRELLAGNSAALRRAAAWRVGRPPRITLGSVPAQVTDGRLDLPVTIQEQGGGVGDLRVYVNGTAVVADAGTQAASKARTISLRLASGRNEINVVAFTADNMVSSEPVQVVVEASSAVQRKPRLHALIVGIDEFQNPALNLRYAVNDAKAIAEVFRRQSAGTIFEKVDLQVLTEPGQTTRAALLKAFEQYRDVAPEDVFVFYVASHGTVEGDDLSSKEYFLITSNVGSASLRALRRDAISQQEMKNLIGNIPAGKKALLLDTCHSGALGLALQGGTRGLAEDSAVKVLSNAIGSTVISASTSQQQSLEGYEDHGVFSWVLLQALAGKADLRGRGYVTTLDLAGYVEDEVPKIAEKVFRAKQFPNLHTSGQAFPLVLSR